MASAARPLAHAAPSQPCCELGAQAASASQSDFTCQVGCVTSCWDGYRWLCMDLSIWMYLFACFVLPKIDVHCTALQCVTLWKSTYAWPVLSLWGYQRICIIVLHGKMFSRPHKQLCALQLTGLPEASWQWEAAQIALDKPLIQSMCPMWVTKLCFPLLVCALDGTAKTKTSKGALWTLIRLYIFVVTEGSDRVKNLHLLQSSVEGLTFAGPHGGDGAERQACDA